MKAASKQNGFSHPNATGGSQNSNLEAKKRLSENNALKNPRSIPVKRGQIAGLLGRLPKNKSERKEVKGLKTKVIPRGQKRTLKSDPKLDAKENNNEMNTRSNIGKGSENSKGLGPVQQDIKSQLALYHQVNSNDYDDICEAERIAQQYFDDIQGPKKIGR